MPDITLFAQQLLATIDEGRRTGTHKLVTLLALLDACAAADPSDDETLELPVAAVADAALRILWRQTLPYPGLGDVLTQVSGNRSNAMVSAAREFREAAEQRGYQSVHAAMAGLPTHRRRAVTALTKVLVENPLPRLQVTGTGVEPFLFATWEPMGTVRQLATAQGRSEPVVPFRPGAAATLVRLGPLVRPLIESAFVADVARWNGLAREEADLRERLFGAERAAWPEGLARALHDIQQGRCFYDGKPVRLGEAEIDHVLPWSRTHLNAIPNLVLARQSLNSSKSDFLPSAEIIERWSAHLPLLVDLAHELDQPPETSRMVQIARSTYRMLPQGTPLWNGRVAGQRQLVAFTNRARDRILEALSQQQADVAAEHPEGYH